MFSRENVSKHRVYGSVPAVFSHVLQHYTDNNESFIQYLSLLVGHKHRKPIYHWEGGKCIQSPQGRGRRGGTWAGGGKSQGTGHPPQYETLVLIIIEISTVCTVTQREGGGIIIHRNTVVLK